MIDDDADKTGAAPSGETRPTRAAGGPESTLPPSLTALGDYRLVRELGRGGMGTVFEAEQSSMHRRVALKVLGRGLAVSHEELTRFEREAWIAGRLNHPHVVKVFERGEVDGYHFIAMELVEGPSLRHWIEERRRAGDDLASERSRGGRDEIRRTVEMFVGVADGLASIHDHGVIHRDLKPGNLLMAGDNKVLISDFGLARDTEASRLTRRGDFFGTIAYMSPEQLVANRMPVGPQSDIWSFGVSLYEALTLCLPFQATGEEALIGAILTSEPVSVRRRVRSIPLDLDKILTHCLQRDPKQRYATASELRDDLRRFLTGEPVRARRAPWVRRLWHAAKRRAGVFALATVVLAVGASGLLALNAQRARRERDVEFVSARLSQGRASWRPPDQLDEVERRVRAELLERRLSSTQTERLMRGLIRASLTTSTYWSPEAPWNPLFKLDLPRSWRLHIVSFLRTNVGDRSCADRAPYLLYTIRPPCRASELPRRPGETSMKVSATLFVFDEEALEAAYGRNQTAPASWDLALGGDEWEAAWKVMKERFRPLEVQLADVAQANWQVMERLPEGYPAPVRSVEFDRAIESIRILDVEAVCEERRVSSVYLRFASGALPAAISGSLHLTDRDRRWEFLAADFSYATPLGASADGMWSGHFHFEPDRLELPAGVACDALVRQGPFRGWARFVSDRLAAAREAGANAFWDGSFEREIRVTVKKVK